jgi:hypothetical protein
MEEETKGEQVDVILDTPVDNAPTPSGEESSTMEKRFDVKKWSAVALWSWGKKSP